MQYWTMKPAVLHTNMASSAYGEGASTLPSKLESKDLPSLRRLGRGLSGFIYETTLHGNRYTRKDFPLGSAMRNYYFEKEAKPLFDLDHPNIVKCFGYTIGKSSCSLLQEYVDDNLQNTIQRRIEEQRKNSTTLIEGSAKSPGREITTPFDLPNSVNIISQIAAGMKYLHDNEVIHGDLKPKNVLVCSELDEMEGDETEGDETEEGDEIVGDDLEVEPDDMESGEMLVKVADFGLVQTKRRIKLGTKRTRHFEVLMWKAPELFRKLLGPLTDDPFIDSDVDEVDLFGSHGDDEFQILVMADVYSFGLTCSHILGGKLLYPDLSLSQLRKQRTQSFRPELPSAPCPDCLRDLVYSCLEFNPLSRPNFSNIYSRLKALQSQLPALMTGGLIRRTKMGFVGDESHGVVAEAAKDPTEEPHLQDVDYFEEASSSIELVQQLASHQVQLNLFQCQYLSSKLAETGSFLKAKSDTVRAIVDRNDVRRKALLMLHFTVKRAEKLVRNCCCEMESWLESALTLAHIKEDIVDILLDMRWWTSMVDIAIASVTWMSSGQQIELELLNCAEEGFESLLKQLQLPSNELDEAVTKDKDQLMTWLRDVRALYGGRNGHSQQNREYLLAAHVQSRLENKVFDTMGNADLNYYEDSRMIGLGGFGAVMNVRWLGRRCALKILNYKCTKEATIVSAFQHPHIVQFFRYWEAPYGVTPSETPYCTPDGTPYSTPYGTPYHGTPGDTFSGAPPSDTSMGSDSLKELQSHILMELLPTNLEMHMKAFMINANSSKFRVGSKRRSEPSRELPISEDVAIDVMLQMAKAMWYLNSKDVAHRDLKPSNVLVRSVSKDEVPELSDRGYLRVKLGDFGLAKTKACSQASSKQSAMLGTKIYGAPEVFTTEAFSEKKFPRRADVWSFGMMFNEVLSGKPPFETTDVFDFHGRIRKGWRPSLPENCPDYLKFCITSCWELRPQNRPNFTDLWKMVRFAQVRSLGLIRENHELFSYRTRDSVKRLSSLKKAPAAASAPVLGNKGLSLIWHHIWRISDRLLRSSSSRSEDEPLGYLVNPVWPLEPTAETKLDVIFFEGNVGRRKYLSCKDTWVQRGKPDVWWPRDWLAKDFKGDIRVLLLEYSISEAGVEGVVGELQRQLVFSDRWNRGHTWQCPIVLVGHSLGCIVIEQLVVALDKRAKAVGTLEDEMEITRANSSRLFLASLAGCFFYAPPLKGLVPSEDLLKHVFGGLSYSRGLFADLCLYSSKLKEVSEEFMQIRSEHVKLMTLIEGFHTRGRTVVPPASMAYHRRRWRTIGVDDVVVDLQDSNHSDVCKPTNKKHPAYGKLVEFIRDALNAKKVIHTRFASDAGGDPLDDLECEELSLGSDINIVSTKREKSNGPGIFR